MDKIIIKDLSTRCIIGVNEDERREKQDILIQIILWADLGRAARSDRFEDTVDYRAVKKRSWHWSRTQPASWWRLWPNESPASASNRPESRSCR